MPRSLFALSEGFTDLVDRIHPRRQQSLHQKLWRRLQPHRLVIQPRSGEARPEQRHRFDVPVDHRISGNQRRLHVNKVLALKERMNRHGQFRPPPQHFNRSGWSEVFSHQSSLFENSPIVIGFGDAGPQAWPLRCKSTAVSRVQESRQVRLFESQRLRS